MSRTCSVCEHSERPTIEEALAIGGALRDIAEKFGTSKSSLQRHRGHMDTEEAVAGEEEAPGDPGTVVLEQTGQAAILEAAPVKEPLDPAEAQWDKFLEELERLEAKARQEVPKLRETISRLYDEERSARQKLAALAEGEAKLVAGLARLQGKELDRIERGEPRTQVDELARVTEELASARQALQGEKERVEELSRQVKERVRGLQAQIRGLEQDPADFMGGIWKRWWFQLGKAEEAVTKQDGDIHHERVHGYLHRVEELKAELPALVAARDVLRYCVGRLADLLKKEPIYQEALIDARVLPPGFSWPPKIKKTERYGPLGMHVKESWVPDPRWAIA